MKPRRRKNRKGKRPRRVVIRKYPSVKIGNESRSPQEPETRERIEYITAKERSRRRREYFRDMEF